MPHIVVFAEPRSRMSATLVAAALRVAAARGGVEIAAICDTGRSPSPVAASPLRALAAALAKRAFDRCHPIALYPPVPLGLRSLARRAGVPLVVPPGRDVNHPDFVRALRREHGADFALSLVCTQIFRRDLLECFRGAVNYHNGLLPAYRGLRATAWSVYRGEARTGFTFHRMTAGIDEGDILHQGEVAIEPSRSVAEIERDKTRLAAAAMERIIDALVRGEPGSPQPAEGASYFSAGDARRVRRVGAASSVSWDELERRIRCFDLVELEIGGRTYPVSKVRRLGGGERRSGLELRTADGVRGEPVRFLHLPRALYGLYRRATLLHTAPL